MDAVDEREKNRFLQSKDHKDDTGIQPATFKDHRNITAAASMDEVDLQYHTYLLSEENPLKVVLVEDLWTAPIHICPPDQIGERKSGL